VTAPATVTFSEFDVRVFGATAFTRGRIRVEPPGGEPREQRFFRPYAKQAGRWSAVAVQVFPIG
jgi:ketosteroid isomerase-like protein